MKLVLWTPAFAGDSLLFSRIPSEGWDPVISLIIPNSTSSTHTISQVLPLELTHQAQSHPKHLAKD